MPSHVIAFFLVLVAAGIASAARADDLPTPNILEAHIADAQGSAIASYREVDEIHEFGLTVRSVEARDGRNYRIETDEGPFHTAYGSFGGQSWMQNANGQTVLRQPDPGFVAPDPRVETVERIAVPVDGYLVSALDSRGFGKKRYVEAATWHVVREDTVRASGTTTSILDDFRTVAGHTEAFHRQTHDGHAENDADQRIVTLVPTKIAPAEVAVAHPRRALVEFPAGKGIVDLPVRLDRGKWIIRVNIGARGLDFVLDSGSSGITLDEGVAQQLGLHEYGAFSDAGNAGRLRIAKAIVPLMTVGELTMRNVAVFTGASVEGVGQDVAYRTEGLLGFDFIAEMVLKLDYHNARATAFAPAAFTPPDETHRFDLDVRIGAGGPLTSVTVNGAVGERFLIDTGSAGGLILLNRFMERNPGAVVDEGGGAKMRHLILKGVGGTVDTNAYQLKEVQLGHVVFRDYVAYGLVNRAAYDEGSMDGVIGPEFLRLFDVYFDYGDSKVYLILNADAKTSKIKS